MSLVYILAWLRGHLASAWSSNYASTAGTKQDAPELNPFLVKMEQHDSKMTRKQSQDYEILDLFMSKVLKSISKIVGTLMSISRSKNTNHEDFLNSKD